MPYLLLDKALKYLYYGDQPQHVVPLQPFHHGLTFGTKSNGGGGWLTICDNLVGYLGLVQLAKLPKLPLETFHTAVADWGTLEVEPLFSHSNAS